MAVLSVAAALASMALSTSESSREIKRAFETNTIFDSGLAIAGLALAIALHLSSHGRTDGQARPTSVEIVPQALILTAPLAIANGIAWWIINENVAPIVYGIFQMALGLFLLRNPRLLQPMRLVTARGSSQLRSRTEITSRRMLIAMVGSTQIPLILGIMMTMLGVVLVFLEELSVFSLLGVTLIGLGLLFMAVSSIATWRGLCDPNEPYFAEAGVAIALFVAVTFLFGTAMAFVGISNLPPLNSDGPAWFSGALSVLGLALVTVSIMVYRKGFMRGRENNAQSPSS